MIPYEKALSIVIDAIEAMRPTSVAVEDSLGLVLAQPLKAKLRMPRYDQSAMDGIAVRTEDVADASESTPVQLRLIDEIPAGSAKRPSLKAGTAIKVFTGSGVPKNIGGVVMVEYCRFDGKQVEVMHAAKPGEHIRRAGEEVERGEVVLESGARITPPVMGLLSLFGYETVKVHPIPSVGVITMGDELAAPGSKLSDVQIYDSNGPALKAALNAMGIHDVRHWRVGDRPAALKRVFGSAIKTCDVVISCGGASVGDHDHVEEVRRELAIPELFARVAIKPGKPNVFGVASGGVPVFSLPGNPVSALVSFRQVVRPGLLKMMGRYAADPVSRVPITLEHRRKPGRLEWVRAVLGDDGVTPVSAQGSHMLSGLAKANALMELSSEVDSLSSGEPIDVRLLNWFD